MANYISLILNVLFSFNFKQFGSASPDITYNIFSRSQHLKATAAVFKRENEFIDLTVESVAVFAFARPDLIRYHLESIDHDVKQVFVVLNNFSEEVTFQMREVLSLFDCRQLNSFDLGDPQNGKFGCLNPFINELTLLENDENNVGFAGSFNTVAKIMLQNSIQYTIISNDDTRFRPGSLLNIAKLFVSKPHVCLYLFSHFSSFGITKATLRRIGVMDENFWPAYSEDIDYYFRSILEGCHIFRASDQYDKLFINHGESLSISSASATLKSSKDYRKLIDNTKHGKFGRDAYLCEKWGGGCARNGRDFLNSNKVFEAIFRRKSPEHEILYFDIYNFSSSGENIFAHPFNRTAFQVSWWNNDRRLKKTITSPRLVNKKYAPSDFVWKIEEKKLLS
jgi:GT2 family glycosyltransferase